MVNTGLLCGCFFFSVYSFSLPGAGEWGQWWYWHVTGTARELEHATSLSGGEAQYWRHTSQQVPHTIRVFCLGTERLTPGNTG